MFCQMKWSVLQSVLDYHGDDLIQIVLQLGLHGSPTPSNGHMSHMKTLTLTNHLKGLQTRSDSRGKKEAFQMEAMQWPWACQKAMLETSEHRMFWQYLVTETEHEKTATSDNFSSGFSSQEFKWVERGVQ